VSTEHVPSVKKTGMKGIEEEQEPQLKLQLAFSRDAREGTGLKARRLSACLPDEFWVDYCELDNEFKSSTVMPGRRGKLLGKGATSIVRLMCRKGDQKGVFYAVKEFRGKERDEAEDDYIKKVKSEYSIAKSLHHPNIVETVRLCTHAGRWNHVMEYCLHGELFTMVEKGFFRPGGPFKLSDRQCFFKQMIRGVDYLHSHGIAHRDIKLENLLLTNEGYLKITDFGVSEVFSGEHPGVMASGGECGRNMKEVRRCAPGICGSLPYIAPEVLEKKGDYDPRPLDVWSCAMVYLTMTYGGSPWQAAKSGNGYYNDFIAGWDKFLSNHPDGLISDGPGGTPACGRIFNAERIGSPALKRLMLKMLHPIPEKRMTIREVLVGPTVRGIECCSVESYEENTCCVDAKVGKTNGKGAVKKVLHSHVPPKEHKTPKIFQHRFDMGHGYS
jgi:protein-serine/threonine kinase